MLSTKFLRGVLPVLISVSLAGFSACSHKKVVSDEGSVPEAANADSSSRSSDQGNAYGLQTVHFGFDSSLLSAEAKRIMKANAKVLRDNPAIRIQIEGHCDQRGGIQYNIALGEKRANSAKLYLQDLGVASARITTISYGKEHLLDTADTEEAYARNRRANFALTKTMADSR